MGNNISDGLVGTFLLMFTGAELGIENEILKIISNFGVIAVLWFWLKDMRNQMKDLREEHKEQVKTLNDMYEDYKNRLDKQYQNKQ
jgi:4-hydroxybenzoate polyprenyltransferase